jgi:hypothetical protein
MYYFLSFLIGLVIGVLFELGIQKHYICTSFYEIRLYEIINTITVIIIAVFVTYFVNRKTNYEIKKKEILVNLLNDIKGTVSEIQRLNSEYISAPNVKLYSGIMLRFKELAMKIGSMENVSIKGFVYSNLVDAFFRYKKATTDTPFGQKKPRYSRVILTNVDVSFRALFLYITKVIIEFYK